MKSRIVFSLLLGLALAVALLHFWRGQSVRAGGQASVYFVDGGHPSASDSNPGSETIRIMPSDRLCYLPLVTR